MSLQLLQKKQGSFAEIQGLAETCVCVCNVTGIVDCQYESCAAKYISFAEIQDPFAEIQCSFAETCVWYCNVTGIADGQYESCVAMYTSFAEMQDPFAEIQGSFAETCVRVCNVTGIADRLDQAYEDEQARQQKAKGMAGMYLYLSMFICVCIYKCDVCLYIDLQVYMSVHIRISLAYEDEHARPQKANRMAGIHLYLSMCICVGVYI